MDEFLEELRNQFDLASEELRQAQAGNDSFLIAVARARMGDLLDIAQRNGLPSPDVAEATDSSDGSAFGVNVLDGDAP